jgi:hypothetical protein
MRYEIRDNDELAGYERHFLITRDLFSQWVHLEDIPRLSIQSFSYTGLDDSGCPAFETLLCIPAILVVAQ